MHTYPRFTTLIVTTLAALIITSAALAQDPDPEPDPQPDPDPVFPEQIWWEHENLSGLETAKQEAAESEPAPLILVGLSGAQT